MMTTLTPAERCALVERNTAELVSREELLALFDRGEQLRHYIWFEISGRVHIGQGLITAGKIRDFMDAGIHCRVFLADWHTWINDKLGGDREIIRRVASGYFAEAMRASLLCVGADPSQVEVVLASDVYRQYDDYWPTVIEVSQHTSLSRMQRSISIMGRTQGEGIEFAKLLYPAMQAADIFAQGIHLAHAGIDQRKAHVIARDVAMSLRVSPVRRADGTAIKPIAVHHPLVLGLRKPSQWPVPPEQRRDVLSSMKMSKSDPDAAVFIHDSPDEVRRKVMKAFCPPQEADFNPVLDWIDQLVFGLGDDEFRIDRTPENGGPAVFADPDEVRSAYISGALHPMDAKAGLAARLIDRLEPARLHFAVPAHAAMLQELETLLTR